MPDPERSVAARARVPSWTNWARNQRVYARELHRPRSLEEVQACAREVSGRGGRLRAVATGLSFSDVLQTDDALLVMTDLRAPVSGGPLLPLEEELWRDPNPPEARVRVVAGARIHELNDALARAGLGFSNLGGYDGQTLIGAISTSSHGSGMRLGPLPSAVRSVDLVAADGRLFRIEPRDGITDDAAFKRRHEGSMTLVQDDVWFRSAVVSLGCLGIVHSMVLAVRPAYRLHEHRRLARLSDVRRELQARRVLYETRNYEVLINPYSRRDGDHTCLVTTRQVAVPGLPCIPLPDSRLRAEEFVFRASTQTGVTRLLGSTPRLTPLVLEAGLSELATRPEGHLEDSYRIYNIGKINTAEVLSAEYFVPLRDDAFLRAIERLLEIVADNRRRAVYQTAPLALRFVAASEAFLSMAYGEGMCAIEVPLFTESHGAREALLSYEQALYGFGARPHWGQVHELTGARGWLRRAYPRALEWQGVRRVLDPMGTFDNAFTDRVGLSMRPRASSGVTRP